MSGRNDDVANSVSGKMASELGIGKKEKPKKTVEPWTPGGGRQTSLPYGTSGRYGAGYRPMNNGSGSLAPPRRGPSEAAKRAAFDAQAPAGMDDDVVPKFLRKGVKGVVRGGAYWMRKEEFEGLIKRVRAAWARELDAAGILLPLDEMDGFDADLRAAIKHVGQHADVGVGMVKVKVEDE